MATGAEPAVAPRPLARPSLTRVAGDVIRPSGPARVTARTVGVSLAAVVAGAAVVLGRQQGPGATDTVWAEDGSVFLAQARDLGLGGSLFEPFAGYLHLVPRLAAAAVSALPLRAADTGFAVIAAGVAAACAVFVFRASSAHVRSLWGRVACAAPLLVSPLAGTEILANVANLHWYLLYAAFWAVVWKPPSRWEAAVSASVVAAAVLSDPFALVLAPLVALRVVAAGRRADAAVVAFGASAVVQLVGVVGATGQRQLGEEAEVALLPFRYVVDVFGRGLAGDRFVGESGLSARGVAVAAVVVAGVAVVAWVRRRVVGERAALLAALGGVSVAYFVAPVALSGISAPRYAFAPALLATAALVVVLDGAALDRTTAAALAVVAACWVVGLPSHNDRDEGPAWDEALAASAAACAPGERVDVPVLPRGMSAALACDDVVEAARP
jgi:hypothetical protein